MKNFTSRLTVPSHSDRMTFWLPTISVFLPLHCFISFLIEFHTIENNEYVAFSAAFIYYIPDPNTPSC